MAEKSPYYNAIDALLRARIKYVAGGQDMKVTKHNGYEIMSSVRYGKGAEEVNQLGTAETRNQGMLVPHSQSSRYEIGEQMTVWWLIWDLPTKSSLSSITSQQIDRACDLLQGF